MSRMAQFRSSSTGWPGCGSSVIWPNGLRYLWTDAFGVVLLVSLYHELQDERYLAEAEWLVAEVERVLGRPRGLRIGEAPDRDGQYYHYLAMWLFALERLGRVKPAYRDRAIELVRQIHPAFVRPGAGVVWKMREDLSGPYPGYGLGLCFRYDQETQAVARIRPAQVLPHLPDNPRSRPHKGGMDLPHQVDRPVPVGRFYPPQPSRAKSHMAR